MKRIAGVVLLLAATVGCMSNPNRPPEITSAGGVVYPEQARAMKVQGWVKVQYDVTVDGAVTNAHVIDADPKGVFDDAALKAVRSWKFHPAVRGGKIVEATGVVSRVNFKIGESEDYAR